MCGVDKRDLDLEHNMASSTKSYPVRIADFLAKAPPAPPLHRRHVESENYMSDLVRAKLLMTHTIHATFGTGARMAQRTA